jgi:P-type Cu+ transporter
MTQKQLTLPITGMTCANCVATVSRNAKKVDGVLEAEVNYASEKLTLVYDDQIAKPEEVIARVERAGYGVVTAVLDLPITGMTCANCANTIQRKVSKLPGVLHAEVNYANEHAAIRYVPGEVERADIVRTIRQAGYDVVEANDGEELEDAEAAARRSGD